MVSIHTRQGGHPPSLNKNLLLNNIYKAQDMKFSMHLTYVSIMSLQNSNLLIISVYWYSARKKVCLNI